MALATSLSRSSPSGTARIAMIFTLPATPAIPKELLRFAATIPDTCVPCRASGPFTSLLP